MIFSSVDEAALRIAQGERILARILQRAGHHRTARFSSARSIGACRAAEDYELPRFKARHAREHALEGRADRAVLEVRYASADAATEIRNDDISVASVVSRSSCCNGLPAL